MDLEKLNQLCEEALSEEEVTLANLPNVYQDEDKTITVNGKKTDKEYSELAYDIRDGKKVEAK